MDINKEIEEIMSGISEYEQKLNNAIEESSIILKDLHKNNESLSECNVLLSRYIELETQYAADIKRLSFIIDGEINSKDSASLSSKSRENCTAWGSNPIFSISLKNSSFVIREARAFLSIAFER